jgi:dipeptidyl aminopeptidase/acylaminoacyl peptidase
VVRTVVARATPSDFLAGTNGNLLLGKPAADVSHESAEYKTYVEASPISHVSKDAAPFLLMHGDKDEQVNFAQSEAMEAKLKGAGVAVKLLRGHGATFPGAVNPPDYLGEMVQWFDKWLAK